MLWRSKRLRPASAEVQGNATDGAPKPAAAPGPPRHLCLSSFNDLPFELKKRIIDLACRQSTPPSSTPAATATSATSAATSTRSKVAPLLDYSTAVSLLATSTSLYALVLPTLWRNVSITRPSALAFFQRTLWARPQLGALVKSLHVGPADQLPEGFYPLAATDGRLACRALDRPAPMFISSSLRSPEEQALLPLWCSAKYTKWSCTNASSTCPRTVAVFEALRAAQRDLDVDLQTDGYKHHEKKQMPTGEYIARAYEAQAALDLYLMAMRRWDDEIETRPSPAQSDERLSYPPLLITGYPTSAARANLDEEPFVLSRAQLLQHLGRPGCVTDRFDSPLLFARSRIDIITWTRGWPGRRLEVYNTFDERGLCWFDVYTSPGARAPEIDTLDLSLPNTATIPSLLHLLRMTLAATPNVEDLSLTGFLERAVCDPRTAAHFLGRLRSLSIGPPPAYWFAPLHFERLGRLRELRLCGMELFRNEAASIAKSLINLDKLEWHMPAKATSEHDYLLGRVVDLLVGRKEKKQKTVPRSEASNTAPGAASIHDGNDEAEDSSSSTDSSDGRRLPLVEVRLHAANIQELLDRAPSAKVREACLTGGAVRDQDSRLLLTKSTLDARGHWWEGTHSAYGELHKEGREWWMRQGGMSGGR